MPRSLAPLMAHALPTPGEAAPPSKPIGAPDTSATAFATATATTTTTTTTTTTNSDSLRRGGAATESSEEAESQSGGAQALMDEAATLTVDFIRAHLHRPPSTDGQESCASHCWASKLVERHYGAVQVSRIY